MLRNLSAPATTNKWKGEWGLPEIKIGQAVDIVVEHGVVRLSSVRDMVDDRIVLLQITPPLSDSSIDKTILITYLDVENRCVRRCFRARIVEIREGYVTVGRGFPAIIVTRISPSEVCDLRIHERRQPQPAMKIKFEADDLEIVDLSAGGAHLVRNTGRRSILKVDDTILLNIQNGTEQRNRYAKIIRQWHSKGANGPEHLAVIFTA
jgi:hypothetical protein